MHLSINPDPHLSVKGVRGVGEMDKFFAYNIHPWRQVGNLLCLNEVGSMVPWF